MQGDKSAEEDDLAAMPAEEILAQLDPCGCELQIVTVTQEQTVADFPADPLADIVAEDRPIRSRSNHQPDIQLLCRAGINPGRVKSLRRAMAVPCLSRAIMPAHGPIPP